MAKDKEKKASANAGVKEDSKKLPDILQDSRFQHLVADPRFKSIHKNARKVKIDKRFQDMFTNDKFKVKYTVDKYGRRVNKSNAEDLRKFYELETSSESESENDDKAEDKSAAVEQKERRAEELAISCQPDNVENENDVLSSDDETITKSIKERLIDPNVDYARGEGRLVTDSSSDDESSDDDENDPEMLIDHVWGELDAEAETTEESTRRLAVCNMDWDRIRAQDLMVLFYSFLPPGGTVLSVTIYPSEFGKQRMADEEIHGPPELVGLGKNMLNKKTDDAVDDSSDGGNNDNDEGSGDDDKDEDVLAQEQDSDAEEGDTFHMEKLRQYQLNRLRYYYAVVEFDSIETADKIYKECDGIEFESSATRVDLRFIPDDTTFNEDVPTDVCTELSDMNNYRPRQFTTTALQQAKVDLTWDETAVERRELGDILSSGKVEKLSDKDLRKIVNYSSEEEDDGDSDNDESVAADDVDDKMMGKKTATDKVEFTETETKAEKKKKRKEQTINKYKALLAEINEKEQKTKDQKYEMEMSWDIAETKHGSKTKEQLQQNMQQPAMTPIEKVLLKRSEKNKKRKEERKKKKLLAQGLNPDNTDNDDDDSDIPDGIDMQDSYFAEEFANGDFIDPKAKKKTKAKQQQQLNGEEQAEEEKHAKELQLLLDDDEALANDGKQHFSLEKILKTEQSKTSSKRKRRKQLKKSKAALAIEASNQPQDNFEINVDDARFGAIYTSHMFNIDPTDSHFKKTKGMEKIISEKLKRRHDDNSAKNMSTPTSVDAIEAEAKRPRKQFENLMLVKSLKRKIQMKQSK